MALAKLWVIAYRDLGRNRRRSVLSLLAVAFGLAILILLNGWIAGIVDESLQNDIRLRTGHVQVRAASYSEEQVSLKWEDLLDAPEQVADRAAGLPQVAAATPVLWATSILNSGEDSTGMQLYGIDPTSSIYAPIQSAMVSGAFLTPDDRGGILLGTRAADDLGIDLGQQINLTVVNADGEPDGADFTVRGLFSTGIPSYDDNAILMPLARAQAFTRTEGHASAVRVLLHRQEDAESVAAALAGPGLASLTWRDMNQVFLQTMDTAMVFYYILDLIVMLVVAVIIANTLLMAVFERIREMGILAALGMKGRQIMVMFLLEAVILGLAGLVVGVILGSAGVAYLATVGVNMGEMGKAAEGIAMGSVVHAKFVPGTFATLAFWTLVIILLASLYPAWFAARREPAEALRFQ